MHAPRGTASAQIGDFHRFEMRPSEDLDALRHLSQFLHSSGNAVLCSLAVFSANPALTTGSEFSDSTTT